MKKRSVFRFFSLTVAALVVAAAQAQEEEKPGQARCPL
jgi:hypothetical protein